MPLPLCAKTPKGTEEVSRRSHGLSLKARRLLILIDGRKDAAALAAMMPGEDVAALCAELLAGGFVEPVAPAAPAAGDQPAAMNEAQRFEMARNFMVNSVGAFLGVMGSGLIDKLERSASLGELRSHLPAWREAMLLSREGRGQAAELEGRLVPLLAA